MNPWRKVLLGAGFALIAGIAGLLAWLPGQYVVPVLMYHSIAQAQTERDKANTVAPEAFERQMAFIRTNGYHALSVDEYVDYARTGRHFPRKSVVVTFDDGLLNNYTEAYPILRKYSIPSVMFIPSGLVGTKDPDTGVPQMTADQLRLIAATGVTVASHTVGHKYLPDLSAADALREIRDSKADLERMIGRPVLYFAYPTGGFNEAVKGMVRDAGYAAAFTTNRGMDRSNHDLFELKRIRPKNNDSRLVLWMKLSGYYNLIRGSKKGF
jgi:peptidoglycan/xylan/chitin deacetylase (PgdA/CDA1 family)